MVNTTYSTGTWLGVVRAGAVIVLDGRTDPVIVGELWDFLGGVPPIHGVLNEVTEKFGTGLTGMPDFAIVVQRDRLHAILRGDITLLAHSGGATEIVSGRDVTTWSERSLPLADSFELTLADPDAGDGQLVLPLGEGVVRLQSLGMVADPAVTAGSADNQPAQTSSDAVFDQALVLDQTQGLHGQADDSTGIYSADPEHAGSANHGDQDMVWGPDEEARGEHAPPALEADPEADPEAAPEEDHEALASFAKAAEAADAEWNAQLAPLDSPADILDDDMSRTIRPDSGEDDVSGEDDDSHGHPMDDDGQDLPADLPAEDDSRDAAEAASPPVGPEPAESGQEVVEDGFTINYDYLFGATTMAQSVEAAAVRLDENGQMIQPEASDYALPPMPAMPPGAGSRGETPAAASELGVNQPPENQPIADQPAEESTEAAGAGPNASVSEVASEPDHEPAEGGLLIDSVPWGRPVAGVSAGRGEASSSGAPTTEQPYAVQQTSAQLDNADDPDHDGHTVMRGDYTGEAQPVAEPLESRPPTGPVVLARLCPNGHANPPSRSQCSDCGTPISSEAREVGRPRLGTMHISSGEVVELDHSLIIGRQPSVSRVMGGAMPRLVQVKSGNGDISRSHVEVRLDGWDVLLVDLKATNGTVLVREGQAPRRLSQGEEAILLNGDIAELGDGVSLLFDGLL